MAVATAGQAGYPVAGREDIRTRYGFHPHPSASSGQALIPPIEGEESIALPPITAEVIIILPPLAGGS